MLLFFIRHGDPTYDPDELTPLGHRQAEAIAHRLTRYGLDEIYASSSTRAIQTAMPTCEILKTKPVILDWANENHAWDQMTLPVDGHLRWGFATETLKELFTSKEIRELGAKWYDHPFFENTSFKEGFLRIRKEAHAFLAQHGFVWDEEKGRYHNIGQNDKRVALFAHHGFGVGFLSSVLDIPYPTVSEKMTFCHTGMTVISFDPREEYVIPTMLQLSNDSHLYNDGLPTRYNNNLYF